MEIVAEIPIKRKETGIFDNISNICFDPFNGNVEVLYQGVISQKEEIKDRYHALRKVIEKGEKAFELEDWERMKHLLDTIVFAFTKD